MSIKTTIATVAAAALVLGTVMVSGTNEAQARPGWGLGLGIGLAAGALIGAAAASSYAPAYVVPGYAPAYVAPAYRCSWVPQYNYWGAYVGSTRVCGY
jgi:drug/metabolite transporter (DMT)-like permease